MSKYDIIAFDMDGTLLDSTKKVRQDSLDMIHKAIGAGKIVTLSTGRAMAELAEYKETFKELQYYIAMSGALIWDNQAGRPLQERTFSYEEVKQCFAAAEGADTMLQLLSPQSTVDKNYIPHMEEFAMGRYIKLFKETAMVLDDLQEYYEKERPSIYKFNMYFRNHEDRAAMMAKLSGLPVTAVYSEGFALEISPKGTSKGYGLKSLCDLLGIPIERAIAVGDGGNDEEIIKMAGLSIAMGNADEKIKQLADVVVRDNDHGGCAQAIEEYLLA